MQAFILTGSVEKQKAYLSAFKKTNIVLPYNVIVYDEFKIADARLLQKSIFRKLGKDEKRLVVISNPTLEAQNAFLKTLEELPDYMFVFFVSENRGMFLSTVVSRCKIISLGQEIIKDSFNTEELLSILGDKIDIRKINAVIDRIGTKEEIESFIVSVRNVLRRLVENGQDYSTVFSLLKTFTVYFSLVKSNNINKKMMMENSVNFLSFKKNNLI
jgi:DNA polymerase III delta prime subunit